jgi:very-short-patch-repair endonuclease
MRISPEAAKRLGIDGSNSVAVKRDSSFSRNLCEGLIQEVYHLTGVRGVTEFCFHPIRRWRFDVSFIDARIAVELNGWTSHHRRGRMEEDNVKLAAAVRLGWRVFYCTVKQASTIAPLWVSESLLERP